MNGTEVNPRYSENALKEKAFLQELIKSRPFRNSLATASFLDRAL